MLYLEAAGATFTVWREIVLLPLGSLWTSVDTLKVFSSIFQCSFLPRLLLAGIANSIASVLFWLMSTSILYLAVPLDLEIVLLLCLEPLCFPLNQLLLTTARFSQCQRLALWGYPLDRLGPPQFILIIVLLCLWIPLKQVTDASGFIAGRGSDTQ